ncbi:MAG: tRNA 2-thiouridine(34) synthase MnmA [Myxococcota bacterium]
MKVVAALSGGVDSSVAAGLLLEAGHEVLGMTLKLAPDRDGAPASQRCCSVDDAMDARAVCARLGIPFYVLNAQDLFAEKVIDTFASAYRAGLTPVPCLACNVDLKFGHLLQRARAMDARLATGHYARIVRGAHGPELHTPVDAEKDQTYFLYGIGLNALEYVDFPVGGMSKREVREHASRLGLPVFDKPDSQEICFVPDDGHARFVERWDGLGERPGRFVGTEGQVLGQHRGVHTLTVGQRKGLGIAAGSRLYVLSVDASSGDAVVGGPEHLEATGLVADDAVWLMAPAERQELGNWDVQVRIRARHTPAAARVEVLGDGTGFRVRFREPQRSIAPGQSAVVYRGTRCLGGGIIRGRLESGTSVAPQVETHQTVT